MTTYSDEEMRTNALWVWAAPDSLHWQQYWYWMRVDSIRSLTERNQQIPKGGLWAWEEFGQPHVLSHIGLYFGFNFLPVWKTI